MQDVTTPPRYSLLFGNEKLPCLGDFWWSLTAPAGVFGAGRQRGFFTRLYVIRPYLV